MDYVILKNYTKEIKGQVILDNINYSFEKGKIYGLYGKNGSGKTMLLRAISGLIKPTSGSVEVNGKVIGKDIDFSEDTGIIIETLSLFPEYNAIDNLRMIANIQKKATDKDIVDALEKVGLDPSNKKKIKTYSLGMKQKLNIAQAIFENQQLLLLDEPTNALDAESVKNIYNLFVEQKNMGKTIIVASHVKEDLMNVCDEIVYIENGKILKEEMKIC